MLGDQSRRGVRLCGSGFAGVRTLATEAVMAAGQVVCDEGRGCFEAPMNRS